LEKRNNDKKFINTIYSDSQGPLINKQQDILKKLVDFYKELYTDNKKVPEHKCFNFLELPLPVINNEDQTNCDKPISELECLTAISQLARNKSPGLDGFSVEFYKTFWNDIK